MRITLNELRRIIREQIEIDDFCDAIEFVESWYDDHRKISNEKVEKWARSYPFTGLAYRAVYPGESVNTGRSWAGDLQSFKRFLADVDPELNGAEVYTANVTGLDLGKMCSDLITMGTKNEKVQRIAYAGEVVAIRTPLDASLYGYVAPRGEIEKED